VGRLREPFASIVAEPFDPERLAKAVAGTRVYNPDLLSLIQRLEREKKLPVGKTLP
jgi:hypothetical protein